MIEIRRHANSWRASTTKTLLSYFSLGLCVAFFTGMLGWQISPAVAHLRAENRPDRDRPTQITVTVDPLLSQLPTRDLPGLVQAGKERYQAGQYTGAISVWQQAAEGFASQDDRLNQAAVLSNLALVYQQLGQWTEANAAIAQSLELLQTERGSADRQKILAPALNIQGNLQLSQGQAEQALTSWQKATEVYEQMGDTAGVTRGLINQTQALRALGLYLRAKATLEQVNQSLKDQPDSLLKAASLLNLGDALRLVGDLGRSEVVLQQSLAISQKADSPSDITLALLSLGNTARARQDTTNALNYYQQATTTSRVLLTKVQAQLNQLRLLIDLEKWAAAETLSTQLQPQLDKLPASRTSVYARVNLAQSLIKLAQSSGLKVKNQLSPANLVPDVLQNAAQVLAVAVQQAKSLGDQRAESYALGYLGELYEQSQQPSEAQSLTEQALILAQTSNAPDIAYRWQWQLGRLLKVQNDDEHAIAAYSEAVNTLSSIRNDLVSSNLDIQFSFKESVEPVYRQLVGLLLQPNSETTSQANLKKAREVIESLQLAELDNFFREACLTGRPAQIDQIDPSAAVIYPIILPDRLEVVVSVPNQPLRHYAQPIAQNDLETVLAKMRRSLRRTSSKQERLAIAQQLYDLLIRPAEPDLVTAEIKTLAFVLDGSLKNLPMAVLHDGQKFLIEKYSLALTPGLQLLDPRPLARTQLRVLVGGLSESRQGFLPLPGVESEVSQIKTEIPAQVLLNQSFTSTAVQKQISATPFRVVHLATHGQFSSNAADTFILTWDSRIDVKQLGEILQNREQAVRTPIELLVLSACQTADGDRRAALGLAGVAVRSGARSTIATLWPVDDQSTSIFMVEFYKQLAQADVTKAEALRRAQLALLQQSRFRHPFYWAPFVLVGNWL